METSGRAGEDLGDGEILLPDRHGRTLLCSFCAAFFCAALSWAIGERRGEVPPGGDPVAYLLAARYDPLSENFDNPSHGWGYPALIKAVCRLGPDEDQSSRAISALSVGSLTFVGGILFARCLPPGPALLALSVLATHPTVIGLGSVAMSDALFAALCSLVVWLLFLRESSAGLVTLAGSLAMASLFVRGNGVALIGSSVVALSCVPRDRPRRLMAFSAGVAACYLMALVGFGLGDLPGRLVFRSGAGELAFAVLDRSNTWLHRADYELAYPSYGPLLAEHWRTLIRAAAKTIYHVHDWWFLPTFPLLGFFIIPGLLRWLSLLDPPRFGLSLVYLAVQATYLWSGRFEDPRHLFADFPFLILLAFQGVLLLPGRRASRPGRGRPGSVRSVAMTLLTLGSLGYATAKLAPMSRPAPSVAGEMHRAGDWLRANASRDDRVTATRLNIAYHGRIRPVDFVQAFGTESPKPDEIRPKLEASGSRWLAWIKGHSHKEFPGLIWLESAGGFPGGSLRYENGRVRIFEVGPAQRGGQGG